MLCLTTYAYDPEPLAVVLGLSIFLVPAAVLWGVAKSQIYSFKVSLILKSLSLGLTSTALLVGVSIILASGTLAGHYHLYDISRFDLMFWLVGKLGFPLASVVTTFLSTIISLIVLRTSRSGGD